MASKPREAAKRLMAGEYGENGFLGHYSQLHDGFFVAAQFLLDHPADEDEPITLDWLKSIGGQEQECLGEDCTHIVVAFYHSIHYDCHANGIRTSNGVGWQAFNSWQDSAIDIGGPETRGQFRAIAKVLELELEEPEIRSPFLLPHDKADGTQSLSQD